MVPFASPCGPPACQMSGSLKGHVGCHSPKATEQIRAFVWRSGIDIEIRVQRPSELPATNNLKFVAVIVPTSDQLEATSRYTAVHSSTLCFEPNLSYQQCKSWGIGIPEAALNGKLVAEAIGCSLLKFIEFSRKLERSRGHLSAITKMD